VTASELRIDPLSGHRVIFAPDSKVFGVGGFDAAGQPMLAGRADREADLFWAVPATGVHERVAGVAGELPATLDRWRERMRAHADAACLHLASDSATLPEADLYVLPFVPADIARERERFGAYATRTMGGNLLADLLQEEVRKRERVVAIDADAVLLSAFAARRPYALTLVPRTPRSRFEDDGPTGGGLLDTALAKLAARLPDTVVDLWVRTAPRGAEYFCWRIDLLPRRLAPEALELGAGIDVGSVTPEQAAAELRDL
jgi:UDPglucose--hexose-1-phosphate uridylyltransferase